MTTKQTERYYLDYLNREDRVNLFLEFQAKGYEFLIFDTWGYVSAITEEEYIKRKENEFKDYIKRNEDEDGLMSFEEYLHEHDELYRTIEHELCTLESLEQ